MTERALGDPRVYPENRGFCMPDGTLADCHDAGGVLDAASANFGTVRLGEGHLSLERCDA